MQVNAFALWRLIERGFFIYNLKIVHLKKFSFRIQMIRCCSRGLEGYVFFFFD